jgi:hypothetical protein
LVTDPGFGYSYAPTIPLQNRRRQHSSVLLQSRCIAQALSLRTHGRSEISGALPASFPERQILADRIGRATGVPANLKQNEWHAGD